MLFNAPLKQFPFPTFCFLEAGFLTQRKIFKFCKNFLLHIFSEYKILFIITLLSNISILMDANWIKILIEAQDSKFNTLNQRISKLEQQSKLDKQEFARININQMKIFVFKFNELEQKLNKIQDELRVAQISANEIVEKNENKTTKTQKIKQGQDEALNYGRNQIQIMQNKKDIQLEFQQIQQDILKQDNPKCRLNDDTNTKQFMQSQQSNSHSIQFNLQIDGPQLPVYKTNTGKKFHLEKCEWLRSSKIPILREQALLEGLEECKICKPSM